MMYKCRKARDGACTQSFERGGEGETACEFAKSVRYGRTSRVESNQVTYPSAADMPRIYARGGDSIHNDETETIRNGTKASGGEGARGERV